MLKRLFLLTWQIFRKNFLFRQKNKNAPFVGISDKETQHFDQCNENQTDGLFKNQIKAMKRL
jgi:hypothetical protein